MIVLLMGDQRANADDRMVDVFRKLVAHCGADFLGSLIEQIISRSKTADIGYCLNVPDENMWHVIRLAYRGSIETFFGLPKVSTL
jgi:hypothetical protein